MRVIRKSGYSEKTTWIKVTDMTTNEILFEWRD
jgi:hypothetical protein